MKSKYLPPILFISAAITGAYFLYAFIAAAYASNCDGFSCLGILPLAFLMMLSISVLLIIGLITFIAILVHKTTVDKTKIP